MTTYLERLAADGGHNHRLYVAVEGVPYVFHCDADFPSSYAGGATPLALITQIIQTNRQLNPNTRRIEGHSLTIRLLDDGAGVLAALFAARSYRTSYVSSSVGAAGDVTVKGVGGLPAAGTVYLEDEAVTYTSIVGTTLTGCTRGAFSTEAGPHLGDADDGDDVFVAPPSWKGRRVFLFGYFKPKDVSPQGASLAELTLSRQLGTFIIDDVPEKQTTTEWVISCKDLVEELGAKKLGDGFIDNTIPEARQGSNAGGNLELVVGEGAAFNQFTVGTATTYVRIKKSGDGENPYAILPLVGQVSTDSIEYSYAEALVVDDVASAAVSEVRHIAVLRGSPAIVALYVIMSRLGDGTNGTYDVLPGFDAGDVGEANTRMGAGISSGDVDIDSFLAFTSGPSWSYVIDDVLPLSDFMFELCLAVGAAWLPSRSGELKLISLAEDGANPVMTVDDKIMDRTQPITMKYDEANIYPRLRFSCNYDIATRAYRYIANFIDVKLRKRFKRREDELQLKSKSICVEGQPGVRGRPTVTQAELAGSMRRVQAAEGRGRAFISGVANLRITKAEVGDVVTLNNLIAIDGLGNQVLINQPARITAMDPHDYSGKVPVTFQLLDKLWRVAPACTIDSRAGAVLTLNAADIGIPNATPGKMFADTGVFVFDVSGPTKHQANVIAHTDLTITLDAAPAFANDHNVDFVKLDSQTNGSGAASEDGYTDDEFLYMMPDDENDGTAIEVTRWR